MEWSDLGIITELKKFGETSAIVTLFTEKNGRHSGLVKGATGRKYRGVLEPGNMVRAHWRGRLEEQLGSYDLEADKSLSAPLLLSPKRLLALSSLINLVEMSLPEREVHRSFFSETVHCLESMAGPDWLFFYSIWELSLLRELGYGLDLSQCAATGLRENLTYISPKTGRAVSREAGKPYHDKLFLLPSFLLTGEEAASEDLRAVLKISGHFLRRYVFDLNGRILPDSRDRLIDRIARSR